MAGCSADRDGTAEGFPGVTTAPDPNVFLPGTLDAGAQPFVDALATNFVEGGRLAARLDPEPAACVAERWIAVLEPGRLEAGGLASGSLGDVTLDRLRQAIDIDAPRAAVLIDAFAACDGDYETAFLESLLVVGQITLGEQVCIANVLPDGALESITRSVLAGEEPDEDAAARYGAALDQCTG
ncbi:MAG: hypothetical protein M3487_12445 [Actinomycetota bacterium]|nr:hypothetical protein [Acidimicrobiia bacterium]MDQ3470558.1 hypothetical protein [Actinomycetota bacterium]